MNSQAIRQSFIDFFAARGHRHLPSAPLVPQGDPTLMFTNAGMVQFKDYFLGLEAPEIPRAVTAQKCLRVSGKHNDLENVGPSPRHHTFFEMLGNFSFGDYFKAEAIEQAWQLVTSTWGLDPAHLFATVFEEDDEAFDLWHEISGLPKARILRCGAKDNFWAMGDTGPCGPCSEIFVDRDPGKPAVPWDEGSENGRYLEIWNLVFMQFERFEDGTQRPLERPSIDTGAGLERVAAVLAGVHSNYDTDLFQPIIRAAAELAGKRYGAAEDDDVSLRVIADHLRAVSFLLADGVIPGPEDRGYVLRRLLRRAVRHGLRLGFEEPFLHRLVPVLGEVLGDHYKELGATRAATEVSVRAEEEKYLATRAAGARHIQAAIDRAKAAGRDRLDGAALFDLYETYGQELESVREVAEEERLGVDVEGFEAERERHRERGREVTAARQKQKASLRQALGEGGDLGETPFEGYGTLRLEDVMVTRLAREAADGHAEATERLGEGERGVAVLGRTVFYAEGGGQVGDQGWIHSAAGLRARVIDTQKDNAGTVFHQVEVESGHLGAGDRVVLEVDQQRRGATERNHTATHLLHAALREVLGDGVRQAGSLVAPDRLRFDFTHGRPLEPGELRAVEDRVNAEIRRSAPTDITVRGREEAIAMGAMALFGEKYGERVRTVAIPGFSLELCGGCHVTSTGAIALFLITGERGIASGVRRIEAVTGEGALDLVRDRESRLAAVAAAVGTTGERAADEVAALKDRVKELERELASVRMKLVAGDAGGGDEAVEVDGTKVLAREVPPAPPTELRAMADRLRDQLGSGVVVLASRVDDGKVSLVVTVSKDLTGHLRAGDLIKILAPIIGGRGGGRPDFAQAGGKAPEKLGALLDAVPDAVRDAAAA